MIAFAFAAALFAACGGNKSAQNTEVEADSLKSFEQTQIEAAIKMHIDSIASEAARLQKLPFLEKGENGISLTPEEKQVKPDYLLSPSVADSATTLSEKYRALSALTVDKKIADLYEMPLDDYNKAIAKLAADINDPSFKIVDDATTVMEAPQPLYDAMNENGRINYFWQLTAAALVEQLYVISQNSDKFLGAADDQAADNITFRIILIIDAVNNLSEYDPDIKPVAQALSTLNVLNATSISELKAQMESAKEDITKARENLLK